MNKTLKYSILFALLFTLLLPASATAATSQQPIITLDGQVFHTPDGEPAPYINKDKRTMGSLRLVGQALGVENKHIQWDNANQTATLARGDNKVKVTIGEKNILVNGKTVTMDTVAEMKQGRVFIPVRFIAQGLGVTIQYNSANGYLNLYTKKMEDVSMDNFEDLGLERVNKLPISMTSPDGLKLTVHSAYIYKADGTEAQALHKKYDIKRIENSEHLVWASITLENTGKKRISYDYRDLGQKILVGYAWGELASQTGSRMSKHDILNNPELLYFFSLEAGEKITSNVAFLTPKGAGLDFINVAVYTSNGATDAFIVEKK